MSQTISWPPTSTVRVSRPGIECVIAMTLPLATDSGRPATPSRLPIDNGFRATTEGQMYERLNGPATRGGLPTDRPLQYFEQVQLAVMRCPHGTPRRHVGCPRVSMPVED
jgi:hypothetical protein